jgi:hypothetical protein
LGTIRTAIPTLLRVHDLLVRLQRSHSGAIPQAVFAHLGDQRFLALSRKLLPLALAEAGEHLLTRIRQRFPGALKQMKREGGRFFVEAPDNFWTVTIRPLVESYELTIRGRPESYKTWLPLSRAMGSYSRFQIRSIAEAEEALRLIAEAKARS